MKEIPGPEQQKEAIVMFQKAYELDPTNNDAKAQFEFLANEMVEDNHVPVVEEKERMETLFSWMKDGGSEFSKLKMRYYAPDYRGVHASHDIKKSETILYVPKKQIITLEMAFESPIGQLMFARNFR